MGRFRLEIDGIATRELCDRFAGLLRAAAATGLTVRILDTLDVIEPEETP